MKEGKKESNGWVIQPNKNIKYYIHEVLRDRSDFVYYI